jgi:hypothetical protein
MHEPTVVPESAVVVIAPTDAALADGGYVVWPPR